MKENFEKIILVSGEIGQAVDFPFFPSVRRRRNGRRAMLPPAPEHLLERKKEKYRGKGSDSIAAKRLVKVYVDSLCFFSTFRIDSL